MRKLVHNQRPYSALVCLVLLVIATCMGGELYAETISTNVTASGTYGDVTIDAGVTFTVSSEVTITGNLNNNGGTIIVGEGGVLTVNGNVENTSVQNDTYIVFSETITYEHKSWGYWSSSDKPTNPTNNKDRQTIVEKSKNLHQGSIMISNGGKITVNGNMTNNSANIFIESTNGEYISCMSVKGNFSDTVTNIAYQEKTRTDRVTYTNKSGWKGESDDGFPINTVTQKSLISSNVTLTNGYLLVDGNMELHDNSTITFAGTGIGEDIESTIRVRNISGTEGNVTQYANAVITLASGAKGTLIVQGTYTDKTNPLSDEKHPWKINQTSIWGYTTGFDFVVNNNFNLTVNSYAVSTDASASGSGLGDWVVGLLGGGDRVKDLLNNVLKNLETNGVEKVNLSDLIAQVSELLPIELTYFSASENGDVVDFAWETSSEYNNDFYTIEYSRDGSSWSALLEEDGAGTTSDVSSYVASASAQQFSGLTYFRLKQTDFNGEYSYSDVTTVAFAEEQDYYVYPNPAEDVMTISGAFESARIIDIHQRTVLIPTEAEVTVSGLPAGVYHVVLTTENGKKVIPFIKK